MRYATRLQNHVPLPLWKSALERLLRKQNSYLRNRDSVRTIPLRTEVVSEDPSPPGWVGAIVTEN